MLDLSFPLIVVQLMLAALSFFQPRAEPLNTALAMASLLVCGLNFGTAWVRRWVSRRSARGAAGRRDRE